MRLYEISTKIGGRIGPMRLHLIFWDTRAVMLMVDACGC